MLDCSQCEPKLGPFRAWYVPEDDLGWQLQLKFQPIFDLFFHVLTCLCTEANADSLQLKCPCLTTDPLYSAAHQLVLHS